MQFNPMAVMDYLLTIFTSKVSRSAREKVSKVLAAFALFIALSLYLVTFFCFVSFHNIIITILSTVVFAIVLPSFILAYRNWEMEGFLGCTTMFVQIFSFASIIFFAYDSHAQSLVTCIIFFVISYAIAYKSEIDRWTDYIYDLLLPPLQSSTKERRIRAANRLWYQPKIREVAMGNGYDFSIRFIATDKLKNRNDAQVIYAEIARKAYGEIRILAADKLEDKNNAQGIYADIAKGIDAHGFKEDMSVKVAALEKIYEQKLLLDVANDVQQNEIRMLAGDKLDDKNAAQVVYADIAKNEKNLSIAVEALEKVNEQKLLLEVARNAQSINIRILATDRLDDKAIAQLIYADIAKSTSIFTQEVLPKIYDQSCLLDVANNAQHAEVKIRAADKLEDKGTAQGVYADIAKKDTDSTSFAVDSHAIMEAFKKVYEQKFLLDVANHAQKKEIRILAADQLNDKDVALSIYVDIAKKSSFGNLVLLEKISDPSVLEDIIRDGLCVRNREAACIKLYSEHERIGCECKRCKTPMHDWIRGEEIREEVAREEIDPHQDWGFITTYEIVVVGYNYKCSRCGAEKSEKSH